MSESNKILTPEYLDWHAKLSGLPSVLTDKIRTKFYKRYKKETGCEPWQLSEAVINTSAEPCFSASGQASDFKPITFEARPDPELIIKSEDEEQDDEVVTKVTPDQNNSSKIDPVNSPKAEVNTSFTTSSSQIYESNQHFFVRFTYPRVIFRDCSMITRIV
jgi:hypothetical protein